MADAIDRAIKADALIFAIGIGDSYGYQGVDEGSLRKIAERTGGRAYFLKTKRTFGGLFHRLKENRANNIRSPTHPQRINVWLV